MNLPQKKFGFQRLAIFLNLNLLSFHFMFLLQKLNKYENEKKFKYKNILFTDEFISFNILNY